MIPRVGSVKSLDDSSGGPPPCQDVGGDGGQLLAMGPTALCTLDLVKLWWNFQTMSGTNQ